jgi:hypothetical protein
LLHSCKRVGARRQRFVVVGIAPVDQMLLALTRGFRFRYAVLGLTHQYISSRIDRDTYDERHALYLDEVARLNPPSPGRHGSSSGNGSPDDNAISPSEELRFVLFRHWNLYDAMFHSGYVAGRMGIWKEKGRKKLVGLLAKMGLVDEVVLSCPSDHRLKESNSSTVSQYSKVVSRTRTWTWISKQPYETSWKRSRQNTGW